MGEMTSGGRRVRRAVVVTVLAVVLAAVGGAIGWLLDAPTYRSEALVQIRPDFGGEPIPRYDEYVESQVAMIRDERVLTTAAESPEVDRLGAGTLEDRVAAIRDGLDVARVPGSMLVRVRVDAAGPEAARAYAGAVVRAYQVVFGDVDVMQIRQRLSIVNDQLAQQMRDRKRIEDQIVEMAARFGTRELGELHRVHVAEWASLASQLNAAKVELAMYDRTEGGAASRASQAALVDVEVSGGQGLIVDTARRRVEQLAAMVEAQGAVMRESGEVWARLQALTAEAAEVQKRVQEVTAVQERLQVQMALGAPIAVPSYGSVATRSGWLSRGAVAGAMVGGVLGLSLWPAMGRRGRSDGNKRGPHDERPTETADLRDLGVAAGGRAEVPWRAGP